jgi:hypothetical protein
MKLFKFWAVLVPFLLAGSGASAQVPPPVTVSERVLNPTCIAVKAAVCTFATTMEVFTISPAGPADGCTGFAGVKVSGGPFTTAQCISGFTLQLVGNSKGQSSFDLSLANAAPVGYYPYWRRPWTPETYAACHAAVVMAAHMGTVIDITPASSVKFGLDPSSCVAPSSIAESIANDLRALREKFDTQLKAALEAAIQTKTAQPEKKP